MKIDEEIEMLKDKLYELDNHIDSGLDELLERAEANPTNLPMTVSERWNAHPPIAVQEVMREMDNPPSIEFDFDFWFDLLRLCTPMFIGIWLLLMAGDL